MFHIFFAKVLGLSTYTVGATATAYVGGVNTVTSGLFPIGLQCGTGCSPSSLVAGEPLTFGAKFVDGEAPGNWQFLDAGNGANGLGNALQNGMSGTYSIGGTITSEPGNKSNAGPVQDGWNARVASCPAVSPDPCSGSNPTNIPKNDPCEVIMPVVNFNGCNGSCSMTIEGFAEVYLEPNSPVGSLTGCYVSAYDPGSAGSASAPNLGPTAPPVLVN